LVNGNPASFFSISHGLRQGDLLSHFLFVIVIEAFSRMLSATVDGGLLSGFSVGSRLSGVVNISHLFTDDTLIFCGKNLDPLRCLCALFLCFLKLSLV
jgi:hypothetical protein